MATNRSALHAYRADFRFEIQPEDLQVIPGVAVRGETLGPLVLQLNQRSQENQRELERAILAQLKEPGGGTLRNKDEFSIVQQIAQETDVFVQVEFSEGSLIAIGFIIILLSNPTVQQVALSALGSMLGRLASEGVLAGIKGILRRVGWQTQGTSGNVTITNSTILIAGGSVSSRRSRRSATTGSFGMGILVALTAVEVLFLFALVVILILVGYGQNLFNFLQP